MKSFTLRYQKNFENYLKCTDINEKYYILYRYNFIEVQNYEITKNGDIYDTDYTMTCNTENKTFTFDLNHHPNSNVWYITIKNLKLYRFEGMKKDLEEYEQDCRRLIKGYQKNISTLEDALEKSQLNELKNKLPEEFI